MLVGIAFPGRQVSMAGTEVRLEEGPGLMAKLKGCELSVSEGSLRESGKRGAAPGPPLVMEERRKEKY